MLTPTDKTMFFVFFFRRSCLVTERAAVCIPTVGKSIRSTWSLGLCGQTRLTSSSKHMQHPTPCSPKNRRPFWLRFRNRHTPRHARDTNPEWWHRKWHSVINFLSFLAIVVKPICCLLLEFSPDFCGCCWGHKFFLFVCLCYSYSHIQSHISHTHRHT